MRDTQAYRKSGRRTLDMMDIGSYARVHSVNIASAHMRRRIIDMGITPGTVVGLVKTAPMGDPLEITLRGYTLSIRREDAAGICLMDAQEEAVMEARIKADEKERQAHACAILGAQSHLSDTDTEEHERAHTLTRFFIESSPVRTCEAEKAKRCGHCTAHIESENAPIRLALVGNPNSGKTTLFNAMTGRSEYVGNRPGVTVEKKEGRVKQRICGESDGLCTMGHDMMIVDLPGIYSLSPNSLEEIAARSYIIDEKPDAIINITDGTNLERNLYLTVQLMELGCPMIIAVNMMDEVEKRGDSIDIARLSRELGIPVIPVTARTGQGVNELVSSAQKLLQSAHMLYHDGLNTEPDDVYDAYTHMVHHEITKLIEPYAKKAELPLHFAAMKLMEKDGLILNALSLDDGTKSVTDALIAHYEQGRPGDSESLIASSRYSYIERVCAASYIRHTSEIKKSVSIDSVLTNKTAAIPLFILIMLVIFTLTFSTLGAWLSDNVAAFIENILVTGVRTWLSDAGAVNWFIGLICDGIITGVGGVLTFLPQIALLFFFLSLLEDSGYMSRIAFIMDKPMRRFGLSGKSFIPLLMGFGCTVPATMGARTMDNVRDKRMTIMLLPFMSCSAKLPVYGLMAGAFFAQGRTAVIFSLYILGVLLAMLSGYIFKKTLFAGNDAPFMIELPEYRMPTVKNTFDHVWERTKHFLEKAGTVILAMSVVLWFLQSFEPDLTMTADPATSILGSIGSLIAPAFEPMGFGTWQAAVALLTGVVAKEAVVSSLSMFYGFSLAERATQVKSALSITFTPRAAYAFMVFVLLYVPCFAAMTTMQRELGSAKWTVAAIVYQLMIAYAAALTVYNVWGLFI